MEKTMNLSKETQDILSNFASISQSINFEPGNIIKIRNESNSFYAVTEVQETFPKDFCISLASISRSSLAFSAIASSSSVFCLVALRMSVTASLDLA